MAHHRVMVTGLGAISSFGPTVDQLWQGCLRGTDLTAPIPEGWAQYYKSTSRVWAPLPAIDYPGLGFTRAEILTMSVPSLMLAAAADEALRQAAIETPLKEDSLRPRAGVFVGTGLGGARAPFDNYRAHLLGGLKPRLERLREENPEDDLLAEHLRALKIHPRVNPLVICQTMPNAASATLGIRYGIHGPNDTACYACASGTVAIGRAFEAIRRGELDFAIAAGVEHLNDNAGGVFMGFDRLQALAKPQPEIGTENRPFDARRSGFLFSEGGAAALVLESAEHAARRAAPALAEIRGFAMTSDAFSMVSMDPDSSRIGTMFEQVLEDSGLAARDIGYINAHGTSTEINDLVESTLIGRYFGNGPKVNSTKSILGHTIGASGALEAIVTIRSLQDQTVHVSRNLESPIADLDFCVKSSTPHAFEFALTHSFGFGGHNAGLVIARAHPQAGER